MRIDDGYRVFEYGLLLAANEVEEGGLMLGGVDDQSKGIMPLLAARVASVPVGRWPGVWSASSARPPGACATG